MLALRSNGVLLHLTCLPSPFGVGDLGPQAYAFADLLARAGQSCWQILPLNPTSPLSGESPYSSDSAFAGNTLLISPEELQSQGYITHRELQPYEGELRERVDYDLARQCRSDLLEKAYGRFSRNEPLEEYTQFCSSQAHWLEDYALFRSLKEIHGWEVPWRQWPRAVRHREPEELQRCRRELADSIAREKFGQYIFHLQLSRLKAYCNRAGIQLFGDLPIYINLDSADVWSRPELFDLDEDLQPRMLAGVPPDYFSDTGQLWGNPVYCWEELRRQGFSWWLQRLGHNLWMFDILRIDHFRGLVAFWEVPSGEDTAENGQWREAPGEEFLRAVFRRFPGARIVAEDLGDISPDVRETMHRFQLPGMRPMLFAFGEDNPQSLYMPHNIPQNAVAYTGTHDTNTARGWFEEEAGPVQRQALFNYLGREIPEGQVAGDLLRLAMMCPARLTIAPWQDILGLDSAARMNTPGTTAGNWLWRLLPHQLSQQAEQDLRLLTRIYGRV